MTKTDDLNYIAGFFEGEGSVSEQPFQMSISQHNIKPIELIQSYFGGKIGTKHYMIKDIKKTMYYIVYNGVHAYDVLLELTPYFRFRGEQFKIKMDKYYNKIMLPNSKRTKPLGRPSKYITYK